MPETLLSNSNALNEVRAPQKERLPASDALKNAIAAWTYELGSDAVKCDEKLRKTFRESTVGATREVPAILYPNSEKDVQSIVRIANTFRTPIYPVSTGRNWGYGDSSPVTDHCCVVNLSRMKSIVGFTPNNCYGVATIQPGVTQQALHDFLQENGHDYMVPTHGGGPDCSIIGNALERGYGLTPITDHFSAVTSIRAVLADGSMHESLYEAIGASKVGDRRKSQIGPDIDSLFAQSNLGIVTQAKVRLRRRARFTAALLFQIHSQEDLASLAPAIEEILFQHHPKAVGGINLMNRLRVLSMIAAYPQAEVAAGLTLSSQQLCNLARQYAVPEWMGAVTIYSDDRRDLKRIKSSIRQRLRGRATRFASFDATKVRLADRILSLLPGVTARNLGRQLRSIGQLLEVASGKPSRVALPLSAWRSPMVTNPDNITDPQSQGCGIIWYSPYVPIDAKIMNEYRQMVETTCREHGIEPLITFTSIDDQTFDSTVPLLFDRSLPEAHRKAESCYASLLERGKQFGIIPYRASIGQMKSTTSLSPQHFDLTSRILSLSGIGNILSPGRYE